MSANFEDEYTEDVLEPCPEGRGVNMEDFVAYMPAHFYIFTPCREPWVGASVNSRLPRVPVLDQHRRPKYDKHGKPITISPTSWLDRNRPVEQMTWAPGLPMTIKDRLVADGGWIERKDVNCLNLYRPPRIEPGRRSQSRSLARPHPQDFRFRRCRPLHSLAGAPGAITAVVAVRPHSRLAG